MTTPAALYSMAYHEAGHAVGFLSRGGSVVRLWIGRDGGGCEPEQNCPPDVMLFGVLCGGAGELLVGGPGLPSNIDARLALEAEVELGPPRTNSQRRALRRQAECFVWEHAAEVRFLGEQLYAARTLGRPQIAALCRREGSPLSPYRNLYAPVCGSGQPDTSGPGTLRGVTRGLCLGPATPSAAFLARKG